MLLFCAFVLCLCDEPGWAAFFIAMNYLFSDD